MGSVKSYGVVYQGSKNGIAREVVSLLPSAPLLVDVFAGGGAITHRALEEGRWANVIANDFDGSAIRLFQRAATGQIDFDEEARRWISREDFFRLKDEDPIVRWNWSFGGDGRTYIYGRQIEAWKKALHYAVGGRDYAMIDEYDERLKDIIDAETWNERLYNCRKKEGLLYSIIPSATLLKDLPYAYSPKFKPMDTVAAKADVEAFLSKKTPRFPELVHFERLQRLQSLESLDRLQRLQHLQSLQRLQHLQQLQSLDSLQRLQSLQSLQRRRTDRLTVLTADYKSLRIKGADTVIYCDPPYKGTCGYEEAIEASGFDHEEFYEWCEAQEGLVIVSEYTAPEERFTCVYSKEKRCSFDMSNSKNIRVEKLFVVKGREAEYRERMAATKTPSLFDAAGVAR